MIKITSAETLVNFQQAIHCYICEDVFFFLYNFCSTLSYAPRTSGAKWLFLPFTFIDLHRGLVLSTEPLVCTCFSTCKDVTGPATIPCRGWVQHLGGTVRREIYFCRSFDFGMDHLPIRGSTFWLPLKDTIHTTGQTPAEGNFFPDG